MLTRTLLHIQATPDVANIRTATLFDEEHTIVPCIALVEGVLWPANAPAPELALAEEFGRFPDGWNGRPVVFNHPKVNGTPVSASNPDVMEDVAFGSLFNTVLKGPKLKTEIWINNDRVAGMSEEVQDTVKRLKDGDEVVEVSTGLFAMMEAAEGSFEGEDFEAIWRNVVPDHLAVLPEGVKGACSVEDGCGAPRSNETFVPVMNAARIEFNTATGTVSAGEGDEEKKGPFQKIMESVGDLASHIFAFRDSSETMSDGDIRTAIHAALSDDEDWFWIMAVFDSGDGTGTFVYEAFMDGKLFQRDFSISESGVELGDEKVEVRPETKFVPVNNAAAMTTQQESSMTDKDQLVNELIANKASQFGEDDRDWLNGLEESQLAKLSPVEVADGGNDNADGDGVDDDDHSVNAILDNAEAPPVTTEAYIAAAPEEVRAVLNEGVQMHSTRKDALVESILGNARNSFTKEQLSAKGLPELESIAGLAADITFEGQAPLGARANEDANVAPPAPQIFDLAASA